MWQLLILLGLAVFVFAVPFIVKRRMTLQDPELCSMDGQSKGTHRRFSSQAMGEDDEKEREPKEVKDKVSIHRIIVLQAKAEEKDKRGLAYTADLYCKLMLKKRRKGVGLMSRPRACMYLAGVSSLQAYHSLVSRPMKAERRRKIFNRSALSHGHDEPSLRRSQ